MGVYYKLSDISELKKIMEIYSAAQSFMEKNGNPQWPKGFPDEKDIKGGILGGILYTVYSGGEPSAVFSAVNYDADYDGIEGNWLTRNNYLAVHRVAVAENHRGEGLAKFIVGVAAPEIARKRSRKSIRMDTHEKNLPMRGLLKSQGFTECGTFMLNRDLTSRIAFEKLL